LRIERDRLFLIARFDSLLECRQVFGPNLPACRFRSLGQFLNAAAFLESRLYSRRNGFVLIGHLYAPTGETILDDDSNVIELREVIKDPNGQPYIYANLRTNQDLRAVAESMAVSHPDMAAALSQLGRFFLLDEEGNARTPKQPQQVFA